MIWIKKRDYILDTEVPKSLGDSHMHGSKARILWFRVTLFLLTQTSMIKPWGS